MKLYTTLHIGEHHINNCEDYLLTAELGTGKILCAVMDGCSMGTDSHFASTLTGKILRKIAKEIRFKEFVEKNSAPPSALLKTILRQLFDHLRNLKNHLQLERDETLTTLLFAVVDVTAKTGEFMCIGDGVVYLNDQLFDFEQNNKPDYLGYHLSEDFEYWFSKQKQRISQHGIRSFSLSTDGIFTFSKFNVGIYDEPGDVIEYLLRDTTGSNSVDMLNQKMIAIKTNWGLKPTDDLAVIRVDID
jgi:hypothetical protein